MQKNKVNILSTRPIGKALIEEAALQNIIIDEISFIKTEEIIDSFIAKKIKQLSHIKDCKKRLLTLSKSMAWFMKNKVKNHPYTQLTNIFKS